MAQPKLKGMNWICQKAKILPVLVNYIIYISKPHHQLYHFMKSGKMTTIERAISIRSAIPAEENIDKQDFLSAIAGYLESELKVNGKMKDTAKGYKYKTGFIDPTTGEKAGGRFRLKDGKISIQMKQSKKKEKE